MRSFVIATLVLGVPFAVGTLALAQERTPAPAGAEVYIISPKDGAIVHNPVQASSSTTPVTITF